LGLGVGPQVVKQILERMVKIAQDKGVAEGRRMRVDTTAVETNIHYPTDSSLLGDGVRVLIRSMKKITAIAGEAGAKQRDRSRSVKLRVLDIARAARAKGKQSQEKLKRAIQPMADRLGVGEYDGAMGCEQAHQQLKEELGLDHFEGRSWQGLHRHALMTMIAYTFLQHRRLAAARREKKNQRASASANYARRAPRHPRTHRPTDAAMPALQKWPGNTPPRE
jgi:hypothetical protein